MTPNPDPQPQPFCMYCDLAIRKTRDATRNEWEHMDGFSFCKDGQHWAWPRTMNPDPQGGKSNMTDEPKPRYDSASGEVTYVVGGIHYNSRAEANHYKPEGATTQPTPASDDTKAPTRPRLDFWAWWRRDGKFYDPDTEDVPWYDKRQFLAERAFDAGVAQSTNYTASEEVHPWQIAFANGRTVSIAFEDGEPYLEVGLDQQLIVTVAQPVPSAGSKPEEVGGLSVTVERARWKLMEAIDAWPLHVHKYQRLILDIHEMLGQALDVDDDLKPSQPVADGGGLQPLKVTFSSPTTYTDPENSDHVSFTPFPQRDHTAPPPSPMSEMKHEDLVRFAFHAQCELQDAIAKLAFSQEALRAPRERMQQAAPLFKRVMDSLFDIWDSDQDMKAGKWLRALTGALPGYSKDIDDLLSLLSPEGSSR